MSDHVVVVGSINADLSMSLDRFPRPGETLHATSGTLTPGGKGANQALAARLEGADVSMVGAVGDDTAAESALQLLRRAGVDLDQLIIVPGPTGLAVVMVDGSGENQIVVIEGANAAMTASTITARRAMIAGAGVLLLQGEIPVEGIRTAADLATGRLVLNLAPVVDIAPEVVRRADPLVVNEHEAAATLRLLDPSGTVPADSRQLVAALADQGCTSVVMTVGAQGALVCSDGEILALPSASVEVVDTTGAGDAFVGALTAGLARGERLVDAARHAALFAADTVRHPGAQPSYFRPRSKPAAPQ